MKALSGRHIYITNLKLVVGADSPATFIQRCIDAHLNGIWIRIGRGQTKDANLSLPELSLIKQGLQSKGIELWGWHVAFCKDEASARNEASIALRAAEEADLDGIVVDGERTPESPRFQGGEKEADIYLMALAAGLAQKSKGLAFSSHDQPSLHRNFPFPIFLKYIRDICPQVYYRVADPAPRLAKSVNDYRMLVPSTDFIARYKPTGNVTIGEDVGFHDVGVCQSATREFLRIVKRDGYAAHSFWCWDNAPKEAFDIWAEVSAPPPLVT
jgi:hypothetical protein